MCGHIILSKVFQNPSSYQTVLVIAANQSSVKLTTHSACHHNTLPTLPERPCGRARGCARPALEQREEDRTGGTAPLWRKLLFFFFIRKWRDTTKSSHSSCTEQRKCLWVTVSSLARLWLDGESSVWQTAIFFFTHCKTKQINFLSVVRGSMERGNLHITRNRKGKKILEIRAIVSLFSWLSSLRKCPERSGARESGRRRLPKLVCYMLFFWNFFCRLGKQLEAHVQLLGSPLWRFLPKGRRGLHFLSSKNQLQIIISTLSHRFSNSFVLFFCWFFSFFCPFWRGAFLLSSSNVQPYIIYTFR